MTKNEELKEIVERYLIDPTKRLDQIMNYIRINYRFLYDYIFEFTKQLDKKYNFSHRLYWTINNIVDFPLCPTCGKQNLRVIKVKDGYNGPKKYCCNSCITKSSEYQQKYKETNLEKYGVENVFQSKEIKDKIKQSCLSKYGVENPAQNEDIKDKIKKTNIEKYGVNVPLKSDIIKQKVINTNLKRYGVEYTFQSEDIKDKIKQSNIERYGVQNPSLVKEFQDKRKQTFINEFGVDNPLKNEDIKDKVKKTNLEKYGVEWSLSNEQVQEKCRETLRLKLYNRIKDNKYVELLTSKEDFCNLNNTIFKWKCKRCDEIFESSTTRNYVVISQFYARCPKCFPLRDFRSHHEQDICNCIKDKFQNLNIINSDHTLLSNNQEIDIYIPEKKIAIEYNGLYWHSLSVRPDKNYHLNKTLECESKNIQLIHIFEDEWIYKKDIVLSRLYNLLGNYNTKIYARNCIVKEVNYDECTDFLDKNHIQGNCVSKYRYGLYYNNQLVSLMTFGSLRKALGSLNLDNEFELLRFCNSLNTVVIGGASKLFKYFIKQINPSKIISYCDRRWSIGKLYNNLGFIQKSISLPNYWYIVNNRREHRFNWRKDVLKDKLKIFDPNLTEYENMLYNGYDCIYDCGNYLYEWLKQ